MLKSWKKRINHKAKSCLSNYRFCHTLCLALFGTKHDKSFRLIGLFIILHSGLVFSLPDIPSLNDCPDLVFNSGFQNDSQPSGGFGGEFPGSFTRTVFSNGATRTYYVSIPPDYNPNKPLPLLFSWHGAAGAGTAQSNAKVTRDFWKPVGDLNNFIVLTQAGTGSSGGGFTFPNDVILLADILADVYGSYNIELKRVYGHGYSSGGHIMHTLMLFYNNARFPAYSISAATFIDAMFEDPDVPANSPVVPVFISIGNTDPMYNTIVSERMKFLEAGWVENQTYWLDVFNGGHMFDPAMRQKSWDQLCTFSNSH